MAASGSDQPPPYPGADPVTYPGRMLTYPGFTRGQPPLFVHDCVQGCPGLPLRAGQTGYVQPPKGVEPPPIQMPPPPGLPPCRQDLSSRGYSGQVVSTVTQ